MRNTKLHRDSAVSKAVGSLESGIKRQAFQFSIKLKIICIALFTIQWLQNNFT